MYHIPGPDFIVWLYHGIAEGAALNGIYRTDSK